MNTQKLNLNEYGVQEMNNIEIRKVVGGRANSTQESIMAWAGLVAGVGACFGPVGLALCGPTALGLAVVGVCLQYMK